MCIVAIAWQLFEDLPLCLLSNRDEYYARATQALSAWPHSPVIAGRDLVSGGTWLGITPSGRWAVLTNFRDGQDVHSYATSRGHLVQTFLESILAPMHFAQDLAQVQCDYAGFNLIIGDQQQAVYMSNRGEAPQALAPGTYVLSNGLISEHWCKTHHLHQRFNQELLPMLQQQNRYTEEEINNVVWNLLQDQAQVAVENLPDTGIDRTLEQLLSSTFIQSTSYGTRCSNFLKMTPSQWQWQEKMQQGPRQQHIVYLAGQLSPQ